MTIVDLRDGPVTILCTAPAASGDVSPPAASPAPEGHLTLAPSSRILLADTTSSTFWYSPINGGNWPVWNGASWQGQSFLSDATDQTGPMLNLSGVAPGSYHVFGSPTGLVLGPAWGSSNPQGLLTRIAGKKVDPATNNLWLGSVNVRATGSLTCQVSEGLARHWDVYNAYNKETIILRMVPATANYCPSNQYPNFLPFNNDAANSSATVFTGDYEAVDCWYTQVMFINTSSGIYGIVCAIGWDGAYGGSWIIFSDDLPTMAAGMTGAAHYLNPASIGTHNVSMLVAAAVNSSSRQSAIWGKSTAYNPSDNNALLTVEYRG